VGQGRGGVKIAKAEDINNNIVAGMVIIVSILCLLGIIPVEHYVAFMTQRIAIAAFSYALLPIIAIIMALLASLNEN
jgi:hypothetical protein